MQYEFTRSAPLILEGATTKDFARINASIAQLENQCRERLSADGIAKSKQSLIRIAECRYHGQGFELRSDLPNGKLSDKNKNVVIDNFHKQHKLDYGYTFGSDQVEIMTLRVIGVAKVDPMTWPKVKKAPAGAAKKKALKAAFMYSRKTTFDDGKTVETPRYDRGMLMAGHEIAGPVIILQHNSTTLVPPGYRARVSDNGNIHIKSV